MNVTVIAMSLTMNTAMKWEKPVSSVPESIRRVILLNDRVEIIHGLWQHNSIGVTSDRQTAALFKGFY